MHQIYKHVIPYAIITKHIYSSITTSTLNKIYKQTKNNKQNTVHLYIKFNN